MTEEKAYVPPDDETEDDVEPEDEQPEQMEPLQPGPEPGTGVLPATPGEPGGDEYPIRERDEALYKGAKGKVLGTGEEKSLDREDYPGSDPNALPTPQEQQEQEKQR